jgi:hypothetical protein
MAEMQQEYERQQDMTPDQPETQNDQNDEGEGEEQG